MRGNFNQSAVGTNIAYYRRKKKLTQKKLATLCGYAKVTISLIEEGKRKPSTPLLKLIAIHLDVPTDALIQGAFDEEVITHEEASNERVNQS